MVYLLPTIQIFDSPVKIPCSELELLRLANASGSPRESRAAQVGAALAHSPALLIFHLHQFFCTKQEPPFHAAELFEQIANADTAWIKEIESTTDGSLSETAFDISKLDNRQLRKLLVQFSVEQLRLKPKTAKVWMKAILGKQVCGEQFDQEFQLSTIVDLIEELNELRDEFEVKLQNEKLASMKQLAYGASHEINNPLANISTRAQSLLLAETNPERRRKLSVIYEQAIRAHDMISDMMLFAHPPALDVKCVDVQELAGKTLQEMRPRIRRANSRVELKTYPGVEKFWIDPTKFSVALKALVQNSLEAIESREAQADGRIIVRIWPGASDSLNVSVADNGAGVSELAQRHMFDPFFSGREAGRGLGFGLSKAWRILELHGGTLVWDQNYASGTQFVMTFPEKCVIPRGRIDKSRAA